MDKPDFYDNDWMLNRRGVENTFGFAYDLDCEAGAREAKAWFLGYLHGINEKKRFNPYDSLSEGIYHKSYERGFFHSWKPRMDREGKAWLLEMDKV